MAKTTRLTKSVLETRILQVSGDLYWLELGALNYPDRQPSNASRIAELKAQLEGLEIQLKDGDFDADPEELNASGNVIVRRMSPYDSRYAYDTKVCKHADGWKQYDTNQDASYFGVWVHVEKLQVVTYAEGDEITVHCKDKEGLRKELDSMATFYGAAPAAFWFLDTDGNMVGVADERPSV